MSSYGQHHHGVTKNIVEGVGGVIIGAATVLLLARIFKNKKSAIAAAALPAVAAHAPVVAAKPALKPARAKPRSAQPAPDAETGAPSPAVKRASRARAKPAAQTKASPLQPESSASESNES